MLIWLTPVNGVRHAQVLESVCFFRPSEDNKGTFVCITVNPKSGEEVGYFVKEGMDYIEHEINTHNVLMRRVS